MAGKILWALNMPDLRKQQSYLPFKPEDYKKGQITFPNLYVIPNLRYINMTSPAFSPGDGPFICQATDAMKLDHLHNPILIFGQPFSGKTCLFLKLSAQANSFYGPKHWIRMLDLRKVGLNIISSCKRPTNFMELIAEQLNMPEKDLRHLFKPLKNAKDLLRKKKYDKLIKGELFLDGFDEIPISEREHLLKLLPQLQQHRTLCPIRIWISSRSYFKSRLLNILGDSSAFDMLHYDVKSQKEILFYRWKDHLFPKKIKKHEEERLREYTDLVHSELCKDIHKFEITFGSSPFFLQVISGIFKNHVSKFMELCKAARENPLRQANNGNCSSDENAEEETTEEDDEGPTCNKKQKKKKQASTADDASYNNDDYVIQTTAQIMNQIMGMYNVEFYQSLVLTAIDIYCLKFHYNNGMSEEEYDGILDREYRRSSYLYTKFATKTFPTFQYETLIPTLDNPKELMPNLTYLFDEDLYSFGLMSMLESNGVIQFTHKVLGDYFLGKHFAILSNILVRDPNLDSFFLRVLLFDAEAKSARAFYDAFLYLAIGRYHPPILRDFLVTHYKLGAEDEEEWEQIRNNGTLWHLAIMEGFHRTAITIIKCFDPIKDREKVRKLLRIRVPLEIYQGTKTDHSITRVEGGLEEGDPSRSSHLISSLSLIALFAYSVSIKDLLNLIVQFFTSEEIHEEFITPDWTPMHYAAMHSNLWFFMFLYNNVFLPTKVQPPPGIFSPCGKLPMHVAMSYSWFHIMILKDYYISEYDKGKHLVCAAKACSKPAIRMSGKTANLDKVVANRVVVGGHKAPCRAESECSQKEKKVDHVHYREIICYRDMIKELRGRNNLLRVTHHECIRLMVLFGNENINAGEMTTGNTILHYAAMEGSLETVRYLLELGASPEPLNLAGKAPLHFAALNGHRQVFICLVKKGARATLKDNEGSSPITLWTKCGNQLDKDNNGPMSEENMHFFQACADIDKIIQEKIARIGQVNKATKGDDDDEGGGEAKMDCPEEEEELNDWVELELTECENCCHITQGELGDDGGTAVSDDEAAKNEELEDEDAVNQEEEETDLEECGLQVVHQKVPDDAYA